MSSQAQGPIEVGLVLGFVALYSSPIYFLLSVPGRVVCDQIHRHIKAPYPVRATLVFAAALALFTPVFTPGHSPLMLPLPFAYWWARADYPDAMLWASYSPVPFSLLLLYSALRYSRRERSGEKVSWWWEAVWRGSERWSR